MANDLDDAVSGMMDDVLEAAGTEYTYRRGQSSGSVLMYKAEQRPQVADIGNGMVSEVMAVDFHTNPSLLPFGDPQTGDQIELGSVRYRVLPLIGEKAFFSISPSKIRIHTKQVT